MAQRKRKTKKQEEVLLDITEVTGQAEDFLERYQKQIFIGLTALVVLVGGYFIYRNAYQIPKNKEAIEQMAQAEWQFQRDSFALALTNPGAGYPGFADIVKQYSGTPAGNVALYYAGICCLNLGQYDAAISYLDDYDPNDEYTRATKFGALGDAWSEKGELEKALGYYKKAANASDNEITAPYYLKKYAMLSTKLEKTKQAIEAWKKVKQKYPFAPEATDAEKQLARLED